MVIKETSVFTRQVARLLDAESYRLLQLRLVADPDAGSLTPERAAYARSAGKARDGGNAEGSG